MIHSPAAIIRRLLIDLELGSESGDWPVGVAFMPNSPDELICVVDRAGKSDGRLMATGERIRHPGIQLLFRGADYEVLYNKVITVCESLDSTYRTVVAIPGSEAYVVHNISRMGEPLPLGIETDSHKRRHSFSVNATITVSSTTSYPLLAGSFLTLPDGEQFIVQIP